MKGRPLRVKVKPQPGYAEFLSPFFDPKGRKARDLVMLGKGVAPETVAHDSRAYLHTAATEGNVFCRIAPVANATDARNGQISGVWITGDLGNHAQRDWFYCRPAITAMYALTRNCRCWCHDVEVYGDNRIDRVNQ